MERTGRSDYAIASINNTRRQRPSSRSLGFEHKLTDNTIISTSGTSSILHGASTPEHTRKYNIAMPPVPPTEHHGWHKTYQ